VDGRRAEHTPIAALKNAAPALARWFWDTKHHLQMTCYLDHEPQLIQLPVLDWLLQQSAVAGWLRSDSFIIQRLVIEGALDALKLVRLRFGRYIFRYAACGAILYKRYEVAKWLTDEGLDTAPTEYTDEIHDEMVRLRYIPDESMRHLRYRFREWAHTHYHTSLVDFVLAGERA